MELAKRGEVDQVKEIVGALPQFEMPLFHHFAAGVYARQMFIPATGVVVGAKHKFECVNVIAMGRVRVINVADDRVISEHVAGDVFISPPGTERAIMALEDSCWVTCHHTHETDIEKMAELFTEKA